MAYRIDLFDASGKRVAILQESILTSLDLDLAEDAAPQVTLSLPVDDPKSAYISPLYSLKVWNMQTAKYEFSVFKLLNPEIDDSSSTLEIKATYQGILTRLSDEHIDVYDTTSAGDTFANVIAALLAFQVNTPLITVGTLEISPHVAIAVESGNIYSALNSIRKAYGGWFEVDAEYRLNWFADNTATPQRRIERRKNLKSMSYTPQYSEIINRVYAYGKGEADARINLTDAGEANEYIEDAASQALYGIRARQKIDKTITHPATLLKYAQRILEQYKDPPYQYSVDVLNLAELKDYDYSFESLGLDTRVRVIDDLLNVDVNTSIVSMSINLLNPEEISIELSSIKNDLSDLFGDILNLQDINNSVATQIGAGQVTVLGTFVVQDWVTGGTTTIDGGNITANTITVDQIQSGVLGNKTYRQSTAPADPAEGDVWFDTDDGNKMYRYDGVSWVVTQDAEIGEAISDAAAAQGTADGKVTTFYQSSAPSAEGVGDLWVDTNDGNKLYRWSGSSWVEVQDAGIATAIGAAAGAQSTADGKIVTFYQSSAPTAEGVGDIWFDTDAGNKQYRWSGSAWVEAALTPYQTIATINLDGGNIQINGNQIEFNGTVGSGDALKSNGYTASTSGWKINGAGDAEFNDVVVRGNLAACTITAGQSLGVAGSIELTGSATIDLIGVSAAVNLYNSSSDTYPTFSLSVVTKPRIVFRPSGAASKSNVIIDSGNIFVNGNTGSTAIYISQASMALFANNSVGGTTVEIFAQTGNMNLSGDITCDDISCDDLTVDSIISSSGDIEIVGNITTTYNITCHNSYCDNIHCDGPIFIGDANHYIYKSGDDIYYFDGSTNTKLN